MTDSEDNLALIELQKITKLLALNFILNQDHSQSDLIKAMSKLGFQPKEIAELLGTTSNTVSVAKAQAKSKPKTTTQGKNSDQKGTPKKNT